VKIKTIEAIAVRLPMKKPVQMAGETVAQAENVFVRVESDAGAVGWGEAAAAPTMTGETIAGMMAAQALWPRGLRFRRRRRGHGRATLRQ
jgi:L-alanine-DL-glutamate epimerase-like enolase superfamily enzyme